MIVQTATVLLLVAGLSGSSMLTDTPSRAEQEKLVERFFRQDARTHEGWQTQKEILSDLKGVPFPKGSTSKRWQKFYTKLRSGGHKLEQGSGDHWFWPEEQRGLYLVAGNTSRPTALFIGMHGGGVDSGDAHSSLSAYEAAMDDLEWVGVFPQVLEKTELGWTTSGTEEFVLSLVDAALRTWDIDPDRVYLGGHSMGGFGSWTLGAHHADRVAALAPSAGAPSPVYGTMGQVISLARGVIPCLRNVPMVIYQSADDPKVGPEPNRFAVKQLERARRRWGGFENQEYWEVDGRGHGMPPGGAIVHLRKIEGYAREARPEKIVWEPTLPWKRQFYWLFWEEPVPNSLVIAEIDREENAVYVDLRKATPEGLSVLLSPELLDLTREVAVFLDEEEVYRGIPEPDFATSLLTGAAGDADRTYAIRVPLAATVKAD
jgi:hypothetical protein